ncbi:MAG: DNA internalization-related competence protein ComEC/Rec2 [Desulfofustis sp.]|nr:DNA internalization-related competence protein ComEC/Rec2 [Desulfofustis sp.]
MLAGFPAIFILMGVGYEHKASIFVVLIYLLLGLLQSSEKRSTLIDSSHLVLAVTDQQQVVLVGTLAEMITKSQDINRALIKVKYAKTESNQPFTRASGSILLLVEGDWPAAIGPGHSIIVRTKIQIPRAAATPGSFNYRKYLARKKIFLTGLVSSPVLIQPVTGIKPGRIKKFVYRIEKMRTLISSYIDNTLSEQDGSLYKALLIGDRSSMSPEVSETLKRAGIMHLWAISGMHLGLLTMLTYTIIYWLLRRSERLILAYNLKKTALVMTLPLLLIYALLAGFHSPAARAFIMTSGVVIALSCDRFHSPISIISFAALLILLIDPMAIESPSFQLSFSAVVAIILGVPKLLASIGEPDGKYLNPSPKLLYMFISLICVTVVATLSTLPLLLFHFNRLSLITLPANILIQPLICFFSLPLGMLSLPFILIDHPAAMILLKLGACGLNISQTIATAMSSPDSTQLWAPTPSPTIILVYYFLLLVFIIRQLSRSACIVNLIAFSMVLVTLLNLIHLAIKFDKPFNRVTILNVGHGSANLVELSSGRVVLIDGGTRSGPGYDCGERLLSPFLWHKGIGKINDIFISHDDSDHYNGIGTLIKRFKPERLWLPYLNGGKQGFMRLVNLARQEGIKIIVPEPGVVISEAGAQITALGGSVSTGMDNEDDRGLVLKLDVTETSVLFPGDITRNRELELVDTEGDLHTTLLLSPHHGSSTSNSQKFLSAVSPEWLVISSGISRTSRFPAQETLDSAKRLGIPVLNTATDGTITITILGDGEGYLINRMNMQERYWRES